MDLFKRHGYWPISNSSYLYRIHLTCSLLMINPKQLMDVLLKEHLFSLRYKLVSSNHCKTFFDGHNVDQQWQKKSRDCPYRQQTILSYEIDESIIYKMLEVASELLKPKNITTSLNMPNLQWKATFHLSDSFIRTLLLPPFRSNFAKYVDFCNMLMSFISLVNTLTLIVSLMSSTMGYIYRLLSIQPNPIDIGLI